MSKAELCAQVDEYRTKIAELSYRMLGNYQTVSDSETFGNASSEMENESLLKIKLGIPIILEKDRLFGLQLKYYRHHFNFDNDDFAGNYDLYDHLNGQAFSNMGLRGIYRVNLDDRRELSVIGGVELRTDQVVVNGNTFRAYVSGHIKKQVNETTRIGYGALIAHGLQLTSFYPIFSYEKRLNPYWTLDLLLPKSVSVRRKIDQKTYLIASTEFEGWRYNLTNPISDSNRDFTLRKADLEFRLSFEREIHDWLWFGVDVGYNKNLRYFLANPGERRRDSLIDLRAQDARYVKFSLFIVPPASFSK